MNLLKADKQKIVLFIFIITAIVIILLLLFFSGNRETATGGERDFSNSDFFYNQVNELNGEWKIVFDQFLPPETDPDKIIKSDYLKVPGNWNKLHDAEGFATYLLKIKVPETDEPLLVLMPSVSSAYKLFINGQLAAENGSAGKTIADSRPQSLYKLAEAGTHTGVINLVLHISNFHHNKSGIWSSPYIGTFQKIKSRFLTMIFISTMISGGLFLVGLSLMVLFSIKRKFKVYKNLGIFCLIVALRTLLTGEIPLTQFFPAFPWTLEVRLEYLTMSLGFIAFNSYFYNLYKAYFKRPVFIIFLIFSIFFSILISTTSVSFFTAFLIPFQLVMVSGILHCYILFYLSREVMKKENAILLFGFTIIQLMVILDILLANNMIHFNPFQFNTSVGLLIFIFCNAVILMKLAVRTTENLEQLTIGLEKIVEIRTRELEQVNRELFDKAITDKLTGINNRHEYTRIMKYEDARYKRSENNYAALYLDLDNFKYINDTFGHPAGDLVLKLFASILKTCSRDSDYLFRMGGDEFFILMTEINSSKDACILADRILTDLNEADYFINDLQEFTGKSLKYPTGKKFSVTIGISSTESNEPDSLNDLLVQSDIALLEAKAMGKNRFAFYNKSK